MNVDREVIRQMEEGLSPQVRTRVKEAVGLLVKTKERGGRVVAVLGSGPNIHEGVTTLVAEMMHKGLVDGVSTSSAVISHEMGGTLEQVKRVDGKALGFPADSLPADGFMEASLLSPEQWNLYREEMPLDRELYERMLEADGPVIIKVAGNMAYPSGLRTERLAREILALCLRLGRPFEEIAGLGAHPHTLLGAGVSRGIPVIVTVPQLVGGGEVGLAIGDSIPLSERSLRLARLLGDADVIIESAVALCQEIHDGPFERYTGHGIWADRQGEWTYSLAEKKIVRIDLDPNLERAWQQERETGKVSTAVHQGLPKTKLTGIPFRMEMSGFARLPGSLPVVGDVGEVWPVMAFHMAQALGVTLDLMSYKQSLPEGRRFREWIVDNVTPIDRKLLIQKAKALTGGQR